MEEQAWIKSCTNIVKLKRDSKDPGTIVMTTGGNLKSLESLLDLNFSYSKLMEDLDTLEFDIFDLKEKSHDRELTTITSVLFHKHSLYSHYHINLEKFLICMDKITSGYNKSVKYHNSTHAADV